MTDWFGREFLSRIRLRRADGEAWSHFRVWLCLWCFEPEMAGTERWPMRNQRMGNYGELVAVRTKLINPGPLIWRTTCMRGVFTVLGVSCDPEGLHDPTVSFVIPSRRKRCKKRSGYFKNWVFPPNGKIQQTMVGVAEGFVFFEGAGDSISVSGCSASINFFEKTFSWDNFFMTHPF